MTADEARELFAARARRHRPRRSGRRTSTRSRPRAPAATRSSSAGSAATPSLPDGQGLAFWVVSDNLRKGAATNAVEIAEVVARNGWLRAASRRAAGVA